jgi:hypothetical protein
MSWSLYDTELCLIRCLSIPHVHGELYFEELHGLMPVYLSSALDVGLLAMLVKGDRQCKCRSDGAHFANIGLCNHTNTVWAVSRIEVVDAVSSRRVSR